MYIQYKVPNAGLLSQPLECPWTWHQSKHACFAEDGWIQSHLFWSVGTDSFCHLSNALGRLSTSAAHALRINGATFAPRPFLSRPSTAAVQAARCQYNLDGFGLDDSSCESAESSPAEKRKHAEIGISRWPFLSSRLSSDSVSPLKDSLYIHTHTRMYM